MTALSILWFVLVAVLIIGYFALDGFDLGVGVLYPFVAKDEKTKAVLRQAVGPVWDGNEVWLLTAGGALFAAFPPAYATSFSGFYLAIMLVLFGLIARAVSLEFRAHDALPAGICDAFFFVGSLLPALLFGVAVGNVIAGIPMDANGDYTGTFFALLSPFALVCGVLGLVHMLSQGASWIAVKAPAGEDGAELHAKAAKLRRIFAVVELVVFVLATVLFFAVVAPASVVGLGAKPLAIVFAVVYVLATLVTISRGEGSQEGAGDLVALLGQSVGCVGLVGIMATTLFPYLIPDAVDAAMSITIANAASGEVTLAAMTVIACIGVPLVLVYHVLAYRAFRGRVDVADLHY